MTIDHPVRRLLARLCSAETLSRIVDPVLADMNAESCRPVWRGYLALARALTLHAYLSFPGAARRLWDEDEHAVPRLALLTSGTALVAALPFVLVPFLGPLRNVAIDTHGVMPRTAHTLEMLLLLMPQALVITVPPAILLAWLLAARRTPFTRRTVRRTVVVALGACLVMTALIGRGAPEANQRFRVMISDNPRVDRGEREYGFRALRAEMNQVRQNSYIDEPTRTSVLRWLQYRYQLRIALSLSPIPILILAIAIGSRQLSRRQPWLVGITTMTTYLVLVFALDASCVAIALASSLPLAIFAWVPSVVVLSVAIGVSRIGVLTSAPFANSS